MDPNFKLIDESIICRISLEKQLHKWKEISRFAHIETHEVDSFEWSFLKFSIPIYHPLYSRRFLLYYYHLFYEWGWGICLKNDTTACTSQYQLKLWADVAYGWRWDSLPTQWLGKMILLLGPLVCLIFSKFSKHLI
jgi:hypothetical protein